MAGLADGMEFCKGLRLEADNHVFPFAAIKDLQLRFC
jgi:hypothetical protein